MFAVLEVGMTRQIEVQAWADVHSQLEKYSPNKYANLWLGKRTPELMSESISEDSLFRNANLDVIEKEIFDMYKTRSFDVLLNNSQSRVKGNSTRK